MDDLGLRDRDEVLVNDAWAGGVGSDAAVDGTCLLAGFNHWVADWHLPNLVWFHFTGLVGKICL
jgi:hypothetical protein